MISLKKSSKIPVVIREPPALPLPFRWIPTVTETKEPPNKKKRVPYSAVSKRQHKKFKWMNKSLRKNKFCKIGVKPTLRWSNLKKASFSQFLLLRFCFRLCSSSVLLLSFLNLGFHSQILILLFQIILWFHKWIFSEHDNFLMMHLIPEVGLGAFLWWHSKT